MFIDRDILTAATPPSELKYRDAEFGELEYAADRPSHDTPAPGAFVHGPSGVESDTVVG